MNKFETILSAWSETMKILDGSPWKRGLQNGDLGVAHYKAFLRETYYQAGINPQLQAFVTAYLGQEKRNTIKRFFSHATSEIGHDLLALEDYVALGGDRDRALKGRPLAETVALSAFPFYAVQFINPVCYLGYLFHLEFNLTHNKAGHNIAVLLQMKGIPENALSFVKEHATVDIGHNALMKTYIEDLVVTEKDLQDTIYAAQVTCKLHDAMINAAILSAR